MTIKQVAAKAMLREATVSKAENNKAIDIGTLAMIAKVLDQTVWWLGCYETLPEHTLAERIYKCRLYHGLTKREFANDLGVNERNIRFWETGLFKPSAESIRLLLPYLAILERSPLD